MKLSMVEVTKRGVAHWKFWRAWENDEWWDAYMGALRLIMLQK